jgi:LmbE family N-acetylglucosaminyl deacetylase
MKYLIFAAHPDDEVLGCGGTAARLAREGNQVLPVIVCENASVRYEQDMQDSLEQWSKQSAAILGISEPVFLRMPDQKLDKYSSLEMAQALEKVIMDIQPEVIFTHHGGDINKDHRVIFEATMVATRPVPGSKIHSVYSYETISSTEWAFTDFYLKFTPNTFFDISETLDLKIKAFSRYESEVKKYPHPRSPQGIEIRAKDWGTKVGVKAAEAFQLIRSIKHLS